MDALEKVEPDHGSAPITAGAGLTAQVLELQPLLLTASAIFSTVSASVGVALKAASVSSGVIGSPTHAGLQECCAARGRTLCGALSLRRLCRPPGNRLVMQRWVQYGEAHEEALGKDAEI